MRLTTSASLASNIEPRMVSGIPTTATAPRTAGPTTAQAAELTEHRLPYRGIAIMPIFGLIVLFLAVFGNGIDINRDVDRSQGVSLSFQVVLRIVVGISALFTGLWGWWRLPAVRQLIVTYRGWLMIGFVAFAYLAIPNSPEPPVALFVATMMLGYLLLTMTCLVLFGFRTVVLIVMAAVWAYVLLGWVAYILFPEIGVYREFLSLTQYVNRMGGLGHPNTTGRAVCLGTVMLLVACKQRWISRYWALPVLPLLIATLAVTKSRSPVIATAVAIAIVCLPLMHYRHTYLLIGGTCFVGFLGMAYIESTMGLDVLLEKVLLSSSKSGSLREITSLTGRTEIWQEAIRLISQSPLVGYGGGSSARILVEYSGHSHNILLETALLYGVISASLVTLMLCLNIKDAIYGKIPMIPELTAFIVILGLVESPMVGMPADPILALWFAAIFARPLQLLEEHLRADREQPAEETTTKASAGQSIGVPATGQVQSALV